MNSGSFRRENVEKNRAINEANRECKNAIEQSIREHFDGWNLDDMAVRQVAEQFGYERMLFVLAATVCEKDWDGRFSPNNKAWAHSFYNPEKWHGRTDSFIVESHPAILDGFISGARREFARETQQKDRASVQQKLHSMTTRSSPNDSAKIEELER